MKKNFTRLLAVIMAFFAATAAYAVSIPSPNGYKAVDGCYWSYDNLKKLNYVGSSTDFSCLGFYNVSGRITYANVPVKQGKSYKIGMYYKNNGSNVESIVLGGENLSFYNVTAAPLYTETDFTATRNDNISLQITTTTGGGISLYVLAVFESEAGGSTDTPEPPIEETPDDGDWYNVEGYSWDLPADGENADFYLWNSNADHNAVVATMSGATFNLTRVKLEARKYRLKFFGKSQNAHLATKLYKGSKEVEEYAIGKDFVGGVAYSVEYNIKEAGTYKFEVRSTRESDPMSIEISKVVLQTINETAPVDPPVVEPPVVEPPVVEPVWKDIQVLENKMSVNVTIGTYRIKIEGYAPEAGYHAEGVFVWNEMLYDVDGVAYTRTQYVPRNGVVTFQLYPLDGSMKFTLQREVTDDEPDTPPVEYAMPEAPTFGYFNFDSNGYLLIPVFAPRADVDGNVYDSDVKLRVALSAIGHIVPEGLPLICSDAVVEARPGERIEFRGPWIMGSTERIQIEYIATVTYQDKSSEASETFSSNVLFNIYDGAEYNIDRTIPRTSVTYARTFDNTDWQPLFLPFSIDYANMSEYVDVAAIADVADENGEMAVLFSSIKEGTLSANTPYVVRAKEVGSYTFESKDITLEPAGVYTFTIETPNHLFNFINAYANTNVVGNYGMYHGNFVKVTESNEYPFVKPFRFYLNIEENNGYQDEEEPMRIAVKVDGQTTGIEGITTGMTDGQLYDLMGRKVANPSAGIYVRNGQKVVIR